MVGKIFEQFSRLICKILGDPINARQSNFRKRINVFEHIYFMHDLKLLEYYNVYKKNYIFLLFSIIIFFKTILYPFK